MGSGYIGISLVGLLAECDEDVARDIDARRVNVINLMTRKKLLENFSGKLVFGVDGQSDLAKRILWLVFLVKLMIPGGLVALFRGHRPSAGSITFALTHGAIEPCLCQAAL